MRLCRDCRYVEREPGHIGEIVAPGYCSHPSLTKRFVNYVTGDEHAEYPSCHLARKLMSCGPEGVLWEANQEGKV